MEKIKDLGAQLIERISYLEGRSAFLSLVFTSPLLFCETNGASWVMSNEALTNLIGYSLAGRSIKWWNENILHPDDVDRTNTYYQGALAEGQVNAKPIRNRIKRHDGVWVEVLWWASIDNNTGLGAAIGVPVEWVQEVIHGG